MDETALPSTELQHVSVLKLCEHLGKPEPNGLQVMSFLEAKTLIGRLTAEYREMRRAASPQPQAPAQAATPARRPSGPLRAQPSAEQPDALHALIGKTKNRAAKLSLAHNTAEWEALLDHCGLEHLTTEADVATVNEYLDRFEATAATKA